MNRPLTVQRGVIAEEVLYVLNGNDTVPLHVLAFCVITGTYTPHQMEPQDWPFTAGEMLVVDRKDDVSEFLGKGRLLDGDTKTCGKTYSETYWEDAQWCYYIDDSFDVCQDLADLVLSDRPRGYYTYGPDGWSYMSDQERAHEMWCSDPDSIARIGDFTGRGMA